MVDPIGANPLLALEAAHCGRTILCARNNPVLWLMLETLSSAPSQQDIASVISKLLLSRQDGTSLEEQLKALYETQCYECGEILQPVGFIWEEGAQAPSRKIYDCPACGAEGEKPVSDADLQSIRNLGNTGLQRTRAFQRAAPDSPFEQDSINAALNCYLPRSIFTTMLLVNRLEQLELDKNERRLLQAVLLTVFDDANCLWYWPLRDHRPLKLSMPSTFFEKNLLLSLETAVRQWQSPFERIPVADYPQLPSGAGGISLYQRRSGDQDDLAADSARLDAFITIFPRPNQAFWTLSALWSGWLWGQKGATPMRSALTRRAYDWRWFAQAINAATNTLGGAAHQGLPAFGLFPEATPNFYLGMMAGMHTAGFSLNGYAYRPAASLIQNQWQVDRPPDAEKSPNIQELLRVYLRARGEPATFNELMVFCISETVVEKALPKDIGGVDESLYRQMAETVSASLRNENFAIVYPSSVYTGSRWWLADARGSQAPLAERVEQFILDELWKKPRARLFEIETRVNEHFPGALTPARLLIQSTLESYCEPPEAGEDWYSLRPNENRASRQGELREANALLVQIGQSFGYQVSEPKHNTLLWQNRAGTIVTQFFLRATCDISNPVFHLPNEQGVMKVIVIPGSRSRLLAYRLREDPRLASALDHDWHFLKYRHLRRLAAREALTLELWETLLDGDPPLWEPVEQTPLL